MMAVKQRLREWRISFDQMDADMEWRAVSLVVDSEEAMLRTMIELRSSSPCRCRRFSTTCSTLCGQRKHPLARRIVSNWLPVPGRWSVR